MERWLQEAQPAPTRKSYTTRAINYALDLWPALKRYTISGTIQVDNSAAEHSLPSVAPSRKNYLFAGADSGGEYVAVIYTLVVGTARLNSIDSEQWLRYVLARITAHPVNLVGK